LVYKWLVIKRGQKSEASLILINISCAVKEKCVQIWTMDAKIAMIRRAYCDNRTPQSLCRFMGSQGPKRKKSAGDVNCL
jgi:hypothetical protein